ncbi:MAG: hypothetical protein KKB85_04075, partial [Candidatus Altiarchaeota archaeon]|nr:hypothetical protein [Candidatus Altiarchaeota archaeon]
MTVPLKWLGRNVIAIL